MRVRVLLLTCALCFVGAGSLAAQAPDARVYRVLARPPAGFDRDAGQRASLQHVQALIRLDTRNPPGNERVAAEYFNQLFRSVPGVETHVVPAGEGRANFVARLRATRPTKKPVLILGHMDVVGADSTKWTTPPLEPVVRDGYVYGRGAIDDKGMLAAAAAAMQQLAPRRGRLQRDVIFLATAAEEGGPSVGIDLMLERHRSLIGDAEFAINEGGRIRLQGGTVRTVNIQTTEKVSYTVVATARGPSGHGSVPLPSNAIAALARAAARVHEWSAPARLIPTTRLYFERLARVEEDTGRRAAMLRLAAAGTDSATIAPAAAALATDPLYNAVLRTAHSLTLIRGGIRSNVIPSDATAIFNVRVLPGDDIQAHVAGMQRAGGEERVTFALQGERVSDPPESPPTTALFVAMEQAAAAMAPAATVVPFMSTGATDGAELRRQGIPTYGILPMPLPMEDELRMHGDNERVPVAALGWATEYIYRVLDAVAAR